MIQTKNMQCSKILTEKVIFKKEDGLPTFNFLFSTLKLSAIFMDESEVKKLKTVY